MEAKLYGQNKGGMSINGIIKDYYAYAGENISAGDLVEYINGVASKTDYGESTDTQLSSVAHTGDAISAVKLDENRVFIAHSYSSSYYLYGIVCTINGATITKCTDTALVSTNQIGSEISTILLDDGNVFIAHGRQLYGMVVNIDGTTITAGTDTIIVDADMSGKSSLVKLNNGNVFIAHRYGSGTANSYLYGIVVTINGNTITKGTDTQLSTTTLTGYVISACLLQNGNVFIAHSYGSNYKLYGIVVSISGTTITKGSDTGIATGRNGTATAISTCALRNGNVFIAHSYDTSYFILYGIVCTISDTTINIGTDTELSTTDFTGRNVSACLLSNGNVFIAHTYENDNHLYGIICKIEDTTITIGSDTTLNANEDAGAKIATLLLSNGTIFVAHSYDSNYYLYAQIFGIDYDNNIPTNNIIATDYETQVRKVTTGQFDGIAKTSGEGGDDIGHKDLVSIWTKE